MIGAGGTSRGREGADGAFGVNVRVPAVAGRDGARCVRFLPGAACVLAGGALDEVVCLSRNALTRVSDPVSLPSHQKGALMKSAITIIAAATATASTAWAGCPRLYVSCSTTSGSQLRAFDLFNGTQEFHNADDWLPAGITFSPDGRLFQWQQNGGPLWNIDLSNGNRLDPLIAQNAGGSCQGRKVLFLPNDTVLVACGSSDVVRQFSSMTGEYLGVFANCNTCRALALGDDGMVYSSSLDSVMLWDAATGDFEGVLVQPGAGGLKAAYEIVFDHDGNLLVSDVNSGRVLRFDRSTGEYIEDATEFAMPDARGMAVWQDRELFVAAWNGPFGGGVYRFDLATGDFTQFYAAPAAMFVTITDCRADFDCDQQMTFWDISQFLIQYQVQADWADFTGDGRFDFFDVAMFLDQFSANCIR